MSVGIGDISRGWCLSPPSGLRVVVIHPREARERGPLRRKGSSFGSFSLCVTNSGPKLPSEARGSFKVGWKSRSGVPEARSKWRLMPSHSTGPNVVICLVLTSLVPQSEDLVALIAAELLILHVNSGLRPKEMEAPEKPPGNPSKLAPRVPNFVHTPPFAGHIPFTPSPLRPFPLPLAWSGTALQRPQAAPALVSHTSNLPSTVLVPALVPLNPNQSIDIAMDGSIDPSTTQSFAPFCGWLSAVSGPICC